MKRPFFVVSELDLHRQRNAVDMHTENRKENPDPEHVLPLKKIPQFFTFHGLALDQFNVPDRAVRRREDQRRIRGDFSFRIAEKRNGCQPDQCNRTDHNRCDKRIQKVHQSGTEDQYIKDDCDRKHLQPNIFTVVCQSHFFSLL